ncbi:hypothetical protein BpHYR1_009154 [Brachionus plicatilis]|uniref:Uncharacterized protein n=1 Tax=Brachionus plicatilis TaxID=10195 RepID=A0A3M7RTT2_BRAPC|nr:hypothetical protein BpHYR1_009154 [Brachionus plicatilis]
MPMSAGTESKPQLPTTNTLFSSAFSWNLSCIRSNSVDKESITWSSFCLDLPAIAHVIFSLLLILANSLTTNFPSYKQLNEIKRSSKMKKCSVFSGNQIDMINVYDYADELDGFVNDVTINLFDSSDSDLDSNSDSENRSIFFDNQFSSISQKNKTNNFIKLPNGYKDVSCLISKGYHYMNFKITNTKCFAQVVRFSSGLILY